MKRKKELLVGVIAIIGLAAIIFPGNVLAQQPGVRRTDLQRHDLSFPGREAVQTRIDFDPGALAPRHSHPGEEIIYVLEGLLEYQVGNNPPMRLKAGEVLFIPAGTVHAAKNVGNSNAAELATYVVEKGKPLVITGATPGNQKLPSLSGATLWLNSKPISAGDLKGKVVLVEFWTYTCINWRRTLPYVRAWAEKYKERGLVVIGVHTPEFAFEKEADNVRWAVKDMKIDFPVAMDNNYEVWNAFRNEYWPALYFVDTKGNIRHQQFGEGDYEKSEKVIQQLLAEAGASGVGHELAPVDPIGAETAADLSTLGSFENFLGYQRTVNFASPGGTMEDRRHLYTAPSQLRLNQWALSGNWTMGREAIVSNEGNGRIRYRFHARDVNLIMGPATPGTSLRFRILIDGKAPGAAHGVDVDSQGNGTVTEQRMYQLIRQPAPITDREFEIEFPDPGTEVFDFTFG